MNNPPSDDNIQREKSLSDRILRYAFLASAVLNMGWIFWVAHSDIFGSGSFVDTLHPQTIKVVKPITIKHKRQQDTPPPPPPPKPPKVQPKIKPLKPIVHPPRPIPHPRPIAQPVHTRPVRVATTKGPTTTKFVMPAAPVDPGPTLPVNPGPQHTQPEHQDPPAPEHQDPPAPEHHDPPAPEHHDPPPPEHHDPPPPTKTKWGYDPNFNRDEPVLVGEVEAPDVSGLDASTLTDTCTISITVGEDGNVIAAKVKHSSGNPDFDDRCRAKCQRLHYKPAVQDGIPHAFHEEIPFAPG